MSRPLVQIFLATLLTTPVPCLAQSTQPLVASVERPALSTELRGDIYAARKRYFDAIDMYTQLPPSASLENKIGIAFHQMSQPELAKKHYERAIKLNHNFPEALNNLGAVYYGQHSYSKAVQFFRRSLKASGPVASVYANLGSAYFDRRDYRQASQYFERALALDPDVLEHRENGFATRILSRTVEQTALFHLYLAKMYAKAGEDERAITYLRKALEEGLKDRKKLPDIPEFSKLRTSALFTDLLKQNPQPL
jgi:tetratricopeptide (TPR) repeat protein